MERIANSSPSIISEDLQAPVTENAQRTIDTQRGNTSQHIQLGQEQSAKPRFPGQRGRQKRPTKVLVTMRFSPEVLQFFKMAGDGWQTRINDVLREYVAQHPADLNNQ